MKSKEFDIPGIYYFEAKNIFSGSGAGGKFNFRLNPVKNDGMINLVIWYGEKAYDLSEIVFEEDFELSESGYQTALSRLDEKFESFLKDKQ